MKRPSLKEMQEQARQKAIDKAQGKKQTTNKADPARAMAYAYEEVLGRYSHRPTLNFIKSWDPDHRNSSYFRIAASHADQLGADYEEFVWAQFYFIHTWYGRATKPHELRSKTSIERYGDFKKLVADGTTSGRVFSSVIPSKGLDKDQIDKINQGRLVKLMRVWELPAEEVFIKFEDIFDTKWLKRNALYKQLKREGRVS